MNFISDDSEIFQSNIKPLDADKAVGEMPSLKEPKIIGDFVFWLEQRPLEAGRTTAFLRPWMRSDCKPQELTPAPINLRTRVHGYGGSPFSIFYSENIIFISWIDDKDGCLWIQSWLIKNNKVFEDGNYIEKINSSLRLSNQGNYCLADGIIDISRSRWIGIMEKNNQDYIVQFSLDKEFQEPFIIYTPNDFIGYLALSPESNYLAWIEWQAPSMPWDSSQLILGQLDQSGAIFNSNVVAGSNYKVKQSVSVFQPIWLSSGELAVAEDQSGWWNVILGTPDPDLGTISEWQNLWPMQAECAMPQWVLGMSTIASSEDEIVSAVCRQGTWQICLLNKSGEISFLELIFIANNNKLLNNHTILNFYIKQKYRL